MLAPRCFRKGGARQHFQTTRPVDWDRGVILPAQGRAMKPSVLVVDIGGTHVKLLMSATDKLKFDSGPGMTPRDFVRKFHETTTELEFATVSIGFPSVVRKGKIVKDPKHLGKGWVGFNFSRALKRPARVINDAAMQALGSHIRGRMLFLG